jgi:hypothetical protein
MKPSRPFEIFAIVFAMVFALVYVVAVEQNYALFTYHPLTYSLGWGVQAPADGPAMYWFGWLATAALCAAGVALAACRLPATVTGLARPLLAWLVPLGVLIAFCYLLSSYFLR